MSIEAARAAVRELQAVRAELHVLAQKRKKLKEQEEKATNTIQEYIRAKELPGVKFQGTAVVIEEKERHGNKPNKERDADAKNVLEQYGIKDSDKVLKEILEARKGDKQPVTKLKLKRIKEEK
jgi:hypothetical protein